MILRDDRRRSTCLVTLGRMRASRKRSVSLGALSHHLASPTYRLCHFLCRPECSDLSAASRSILLGGTRPIPQRGKRLGTIYVYWARTATGWTACSSRVQSWLGHPFCPYTSGKATNCRCKLWYVSLHIFQVRRYRTRRRALAFARYI